MRNVSMFLPLSDAKLPSQDGKCGSVCGSVCGRSALSLGLLLWLLGKPPVQLTPCVFASLYDFVWE